MSKKKVKGHWAKHQSQARWREINAKRAATRARNKKLKEEAVKAEAVRSREAIVPKAPSSFPAQFVIHKTVQGTNGPVAKTEVHSFTIAEPEFVHAMSIIKAVLHRKGRPSKAKEYK